jgi:hypothetical protein
MAGAAAGSAPADRPEILSNTMSEQDRLDRYLEGHISREALSAAERLDAGLLERVFDDTRALLGASAAPDLRDSVLAEIAAGHPAHRAPVSRGPARFAALLWKPRTMLIRPVWAITALLLCAVLGTLLPHWQDTRRVAEAAPPAEHRIFVEFRLNAAASSVQLAGSFTNWQPVYDLHQVAPNQWVISVPLPQGVHDYSFVLDGTRWVPDPYAPSVNDGFGGTNSRVTLLASDPRT